MPRLVIKKGDCPAAERADSEPSGISWGIKERTDC